MSVNASTRTQSKKTGDSDAKAAEAQAKVARVRAAAVQQALSIQEKKDLQARVLDTIIVAFDLPTDTSTDAAHPTVADANTFREALLLFRPQDLDEVVSERNIDNRCGYALCRNQNQAAKLKKVWDSAAGKIIDKQIDGKWCSTECKKRNAYARMQLSTEPAWLRHAQAGQVQLLTDGLLPVDLAADKNEAEAKGKTANQQELALERGEKQVTNTDAIAIFEKEKTRPPKPPQLTHSIVVGDILEGLPIRAAGAERRMSHYR
ncbi:hypothetical protein LTS08_007969 [Lithohypha guttulata]|nr:hypothetical protein LTS08_007969 [Lithohypha guttulata]